MPDKPQFFERSVEIPLAGIAADLVIPNDAKGLVIFAHGSGSSRLSSRNRFVAAVLQRARFATLLLDLLTAAEDVTRWIWAVTELIADSTRLLRSPALGLPVQKSLISGSTRKGGHTVA